MSTDILVNMMSIDILLFVCLSVGEEMSENCEERPSPPFATSTFNPHVGDMAIKRVLIANRGEIAVRVIRAVEQLGLESIAIYSYEDRLNIHRYKARQSFMVGRGMSPVQAYLAEDEIIALALQEHVDAIHPGYGFLSESDQFARKVIDAGITWIGPPPSTMRALGNKAAARNVAKGCGVPIVPGSDGPIPTAADAVKFVERFGLPVILKACSGGGGRGCRVVRKIEDVTTLFDSAASEALFSFGDASLLIEKLIERPRHIEIQIFGDRHGNVVHMFERDCSLQRRHQKVIEIAPANGVNQDVLDRMYADALTLARHCGYENAGTVEFLLDANGKDYYFIEVNPRIQVEHTITEATTGIDIVEAQILVAGGKTLKDLGIEQHNIARRGHAIQCRVTTEDPKKNFQPDCGRILVYRSPGGMGIRLDGSMGYVGARISPHYDSLLVKVTASGVTWESTVRRMRMALSEMRVKGVVTNTGFLMNLLDHPSFRDLGYSWTTFIDDTPKLFTYSRPKNTEIIEILHYLGELAVFGCRVPGASPVPVPDIEPPLPSVDLSSPPPISWRSIFLSEGPAALAKAIRAHPYALLTDTTWRDAHQSHIATRLRTYDMLKVAPHTARILSKCFSFEMWGGATFDVCLRFLKEDPWSRLRKIRKRCPNVLLQMLLRGANAVGYMAYPDNVIYEFVKEAKEQGVDVFRVFDSLNYLENLKIGIDAVIKAGGICEAAICYTGDVLHPRDTIYTLDYYVNLVSEMVKFGIHILAIKDMAGLLRPKAAELLIGTLRKKFPDLPIHLHTHDTAGTGVATVLAAFEAGADVADTAIDSFSGMTSQPSMGAVVHALEDTPLRTGIDTTLLADLNDYWCDTRMIYAPFESNLKSGSADVYYHEMPGGQYTNLLFQSCCLGLEGQWASVKRAYRDANILLGDIPKVTPSSKVVGDLAQFLVSNRLDRNTVVEQASHLSFPSSVVDFFLGNLGIPPNGFPEPLSSRIRKGKEPIKGRPGASLAPVNLDEIKEMLTKKYGRQFRTCDALSYVLYPKVYEEFLTDSEKYGNVSILPTRYFLRPLEPDRELELKMSHGRSAFVTLVAQSEGSHGKREVYFTVNGNTQIVEVQDQNSKAKLERPKADKGTVGSVGAPMAGSVVDVRVHPRQFVHEHDPLLVLSAMKMETVVTAPCAGFVTQVSVINGDSVGMDDLLVLIEPAPEPTVVSGEERSVIAKEESCATSPFQVPI